MGYPPGGRWTEGALAVASLKYPKIIESLKIRLQLNVSVSQFYNLLGLSGGVTANGATAGRGR